MTLVIMAAGMGSRFGGLKQIEPIDEYGNFILDYSIYDAIKVGFKKIVFIIRRENYDIFRDTVGKRVEKFIEVEYAFQEVDMLPNGYEVPNGRVKPWGTGHAILCCKDIVKDNFAVINSDDFYGRDAFRVIAEFLKQDHSHDEIDRYAMVGYMLKNTLTENGSVKRGVCGVTNGYLTNLNECSVSEINGELMAKSLIDGEEFVIPKETPVSVNFFGFTPKVFKCLEEGFVKGLEENKDKLDDYEFFLPSTIFNEVKKGNATVEVLSTSAVWQGITYKEDKEKVVNEIKILVDSGEYLAGLWK